MLLNAQRINAMPTVNLILDTVCMDDNALMRALAHLAWLNPASSL